MLRDYIFYGLLLLIAVGCEEEFDRKDNYIRAEAEAPEAQTNNIVGYNDRKIAILKEIAKSTDGNHITIYRLEDQVYGNIRYIVHSPGYVSVGISQ